MTGINRTVNDIPYFDSVVGLDALSREIKTADVLIVTLALTEETRGLVKASQMKSDAVLVNISRGAVVDLKGLGCAAVLDVFAEEPLDPQSPLWDAEKVLITPHNSFVGEGNAHRLSELILKNLDK